LSNCRIQGELFAMRNKLKVPQPEPTRYGTRLRKSVERFEL